MSLSASMWTAVTGLLVHGEKMNVVGNNIANVNTIGFKGSRMDFEDFVNQNVYAAAGPSQVGRGVSIGAIYGNFSQAAFESSTDPTDMAISGEGFFKVKPVGTDTEYYTRAGNFRFNADGYLVDPHGYALQGWRIQVPTPSLASGSSSAAGSTSASSLKGSGAPTNIKLDSFTCDPKHTNNMSLELNLDSRQSGKTSNTTSTPGLNPGDPGYDYADPFFALFKNWDATQTPALGENEYIYQHTMNIYDEGGTMHKVTVYFDKVENKELDPNTTQGNIQHWEYIVTIDPTEDYRDFADGGAVPDKMKGILMSGTLTFDSTGEFKNMTAYVPTEGAAGTNGTDDLSTWVQAPVSANGYPMFCPNFSGAPGASEAWDPATPGNVNPLAQNYLVELNLGLRNKGDAWSASLPANAAGIAGDASLVAGIDQNDLEPQPGRTKSYAQSSGSVNQSQDGYSFGYLSTVHVDRDGILYGKYSNGQTLALFQVALYDFISPHNLRREGGNLFSQTRESGDATSGPANSMGLGSVYGNSIEQSNVDLSTEFVQMITTQRGFQANSKAITTVDTMLETVIGMKR
ncbi:MAG: flagellar hook protein FlgE [Deltaproteobacteria bacterium]|nr:flagellar hook protein FlgE [Deltaproteobacteria bacterium]